MHRKIVILLLLTAAVFQTVAQVDYSFGNIKKSHKIKNIPTVGIKGGLTFYNMKFSNKAYDKLPGENIQNIGYGVFGETPFGKNRNMSVSFELMMIEKGMKKSFDHRGVQEINQINSKYIDFRIPLTYYFMVSDYVNPYIFGAADIAFCYGGTDKVEYPNKEYEGSSIDIANSDAVLKLFDLSVIAGAGVRFNIHFESFTMSVKLDASYNFGLLNVKSNVEGEPANIYAYYYDENNREKWYNRGLEVMLSVGIPLKFNKMNDLYYDW